MHDSNIGYVQYSQNGHAQHAHHAQHAQHAQQQPASCHFLSAAATLLPRRCCWALSHRARPWQTGVVQLDGWTVQLSVTVQHMALRVQPRALTVWLRTLARLHVAMRPCGCSPPKHHALPCNLTAPSTATQLVGYACVTTDRHSERSRATAIGSRPVCHGCQVLHQVNY
jgi:hypothetical protein